MSFRFLGGHPALDFVNTAGGRTHSSEQHYTIERERMEDIEGLYAWAAEAELITASERRRLLEAVRANPRAAAAVMTRARRLRETLYRLFKSMIDGRRPDAAESDVLNRELALARSHERLTFTGKEAAFAWDDRHALDAPLWMIARAAAELLTAPELPRVRLCGGESCGWLFLDTSRNGSRQWCDMADCGNTAKVRRFRERKRASES